MPATLWLWVRDADKPDGWRLYSERRYTDVPVNSALDKAQLSGERWVGRDAENRRFDVEPD
jgi:hypothetical protein